MKRLGLDVGTNSIGWCLIEDDARIVDIGVRIFADGRDPKSRVSLAVHRRAARAMRRRRDRYLRRRFAFLRALIEYGLMPADACEATLIADRDPYVLRVRALDERVEPYEIGRALFHLNQRRAFKSNRKAERKQKDGEDGKITAGVRALDAAMLEAGVRTLGEFLAGRDTKRVRMSGERLAYDFYPQRKHIEDEFEAIWAVQAKHYPALLSQAAHDALHRILFFQRPLKVKQVGVCTFLTEERRLPKAHPLFQERRLYEAINQLEVTTARESSRKLTLDERNRLILRLNGVKSASFGALGKLLRLDPGQSLSNASDSRTHLAGNEVYAAMSAKKLFGTGWSQFDCERQWAIIERLVEEEDPERLHSFLADECGLNIDQIIVAENVAHSLPEGYGRLGPTATKAILAEYKKDVITYDEAVRRAFPHLHHSDFRSGDVLKKLPYYGELLTHEIPPGTQHPEDPPEKRWGKVSNPTVHIGFRQLEKLINTVITVHGRPDQIVVELARELKLNEKDKEERSHRIQKDAAAAVARGEKLQREGIPDTGANRTLLRFWEELNPSDVLERRCPYCVEPIGMRQLFINEAGIDHIIPYSRCLDDSDLNKIVAHRRCSHAKGNLTPYEKWGHCEERWEKISDQVSCLSKSKQWRFGPDAMAQFEKVGDFISRQLTDTQYLARLVYAYLSNLYPSKEEGCVYVIPGRMTGMLRRLWGLNSLLSDHNYVENKHSNAPKNRLDHRHHAIDAAVTAVTTRGLLMEIARASARAKDQALHRLFEDLPQPWPGFRETLGTKLASVTVSHKPDHGRKGKPAPGHDVTAGRLHDDTAYGLPKDYEPGGKPPVVVKRIAFMSLKPKDINDAERIRDATLRIELYRATEGLTGKPFERALRQFASAHPLFRGIRRVRVLGERPGTPSLSIIPVADRSGHYYKGYKGNGNARFLIWRLPDGKWVHRTISMFGAHARNYQAPRPHPAAKKILDLRQNDIIAIERDGAPREIMRVVKFSENGQITLAAHNEGGALKVRDSASNEIDPFKYIAPTAGGLRKLKARQVRIDPIGRIFDPGPS